MPRPLRPDFAASFLKSVQTMKKRTSPRTHTAIEWTFQHGKDVVACAVHWHPATSTYLVSLVPNGLDAAALTETFASGVAAFARHAELAAALRARGWKTLAYSGARAASDLRRRRAA